MYKNSLQIEKLVEARRVKLWHSTGDIIFKDLSLLQGVNCAVDDMLLGTLEHFARISHPRLRRLNLWNLPGINPVDMNQFIDSLSLFTHLTWLEYSCHTDFPLTRIPVDNGRSPVVLPSLQVLWLSDGFVKVAVIDIQSWNDFPKLEKLKHPLERLDIRHGSFTEIQSILEGANMRQLTLQNTRWTKDSGLIQYNGFIVHKAEMDNILVVWATHEDRLPHEFATPFPLYHAERGLTA
ncbi:hypothetical protein CPB86DRAFT_797359 [Serendipita vermifera]|nr:hypothetical protein CPB86DRAFT_797359 [Serendipita vermifera]